MFEKKNGKRFLASVMALVMLLSLAPVGALAVEDEEQNQEVVALPANQADPKPVVTGEGNTANTNEELIPPPATRIMQKRLLITMVIPRRFPKCLRILQPKVMPLLVKRLIFMHYFPV